MKNVFLGLLVAGLVIANNGASTLAAYYSTAAEACPVLPIGIGRVDVTPSQTARQHTVIVSWEARAPQCYTIEKFSVKGAITFANGAKKNFVQTTPGNQSTVQIQVPGLLTLPAAADPSLAPRSVEVEVTAEASAPVTGSGNNSGTATPSQGDSTSPTNSCLPLVMVTGVQASFVGLIVSPENPNGTNLPKFKVIWQVNALPSCYRINNYSVTVTIPRQQKTVTVSGNQTATEVVLDQSVPADFKPTLIMAVVKATGTARIAGSAKNKTQLN